MRDSASMGRSMMAAMKPWRQTITFRHVATLHIVDRQ